MRHRLEHLASGDWTPAQPVAVGVLTRISSLAGELMATGWSAGQATTVLRVPGRIEVLGKHTDYAGGRSLVSATEQGMLFLVCSRQDSRVRMTDLRRSETAEFAFSAATIAGLRDWSLYPRTVTHRIATVSARDLQGADIGFASNLPPSSGLSSSSALTIGTFLALASCNDLSSDPDWQRILSSREGLASFLGAVESGECFLSLPASDGVGTRGGSQDHTAILCAGRGEIRQFGFRPTKLEKALALPPGLIFAVATSGVRASKTGAAMDSYNLLSDQAARLERLWQAAKQGERASLGSIVAASPGGLDELSNLLEVATLEARERHDLRLRMRQFYEESEEIVPAAGEALRRGHMSDFGDYVDRSMRLATECLGNQIAETISLTVSARDLGALAASAFGAGFGGAVWALVPEEGVEVFLGRWSEAYRARFPDRWGLARFFSTGAGGPATEL